jgi:hypothetical protein
MPALSVAKPPVVLALPPLTGRVCVKRGAPAQVGWSGSYRLNVIVPVGLNAPLSVPESFRVTPTVPEPGLGVVASVGLAGETVTCSALQPLEAGLLLSSPL